jgi:uncharacterized protein YbjT (DUF2867 family)
MADGASIGRALEGIDVVYYLVHAMGGAGDFAKLDRSWAETFVDVARSQEGLKRVIYLGGLLPSVDGRGKPSKHLASRAEVGKVLRDGVPTLEFRAGPVIGSGSASFEMVRYLTERLPWMVAPKWIRHAVQPVGIRDVLTYLCEALECEDATGIVEIGADPLTFRDMMLEYARVRGLRRWIVPVPVLAPGLAARWVGFVTPITNDLAVPLVRGIVHPVLADTTRARELFPGIDPMPYAAAVELALRRTLEGRISTRWSGSGGSNTAYRFADKEGVVREVRTRRVSASPEAVYRAFGSIGGRRGWLVWNGLWALRGLLDQLFGGPGLRRGRRHPIDLEPGEAVDFWRVEEARPPTLLRLRAEMRVPGRAWLQFEAVPEGDDSTRLVQSAFFMPSGLFGVLYWYALYPAHRVIFNDLVDAIAADAEAGRPILPEGPLHDA